MRLSVGCLWITMLCLAAGCSGRSSCPDCFWIVQQAGKSKESTSMSQSRHLSSEVSPLPKTDDEWKKVLTPEQYRVTREKGTEAAFTGEYWNCKKDGVYRCVCCGEPLFDSSDKFDSGCGWPSFDKPMEKGNIGESSDRSHFMVRTEVTCKHCGAHLGHVFDDGPTPTRLRYCINSASLKLEPKPGKGK